MTQDQFEALSSQLEGLSGKFDGLSTKVEGLSGRVEGLSRQFTELVEFLGRKFDQIDRRFSALEQRVGALEVSHEAMRYEIRQLAEGLTMTNERLGRFEAETIVRFDRFDVDFGTVILDHDRRLRELEEPAES